MSSKGIDTKCGHECLTNRSVSMPQNGSRTMSGPNKPASAPQGGPSNAGRGTQIHKQYNRGQGVGGK